MGKPDVIMKKGIGISWSINLAARRRCAEMGESTDQIIIENLPAFLKSNDRWELVIALL